MVQQIPRDIWEQRLDGLMEALEPLIASSTPDKPSFNRRDTFNKILQNLKSFSQEHFKYFHDGLLKKPLAVPLESSSEYPLAYVMRAVLDRIANDISLIEHAMDQRIRYKETPIEKLLNLGDKLANLALEPARNTNPPIVSSPLTTIVYLQKVASVRLIPYAPVAIIALPISSLIVDRDLLAIPHELGHYLYWYGNANKRILRKKVMDYTAEGSVKQWEEEVFADIYGCMVGGPAIALDFQHLSLERVGKQFFEDDQEHPTPSLRPEIYIKTLRKMLFPHSADLLEHEWENQKQNLINAPGSEFDQAYEQTTTQELQSFVNQAANGILHGINFRKAWSQESESNDLDDFYLQVRRERLESLAEEIPVNDNGFANTNWEEWYDNRFPEVSLQEAENGDIKPGDPKTETKGWLDVLNADGWTTKGPHSQDH